MEAKHATYIFTFDIGINLFPTYETQRLFQRTLKSNYLSVALLHTAANINHISPVPAHSALVTLITSPVTHLE